MRSDPTRGERRMRLCGEQNHRCCYCGREFVYDEGMSHPRAPTIEHVVRLIDGGEKEWENEVAACARCNNDRGEMHAVAYYYVVQQIIATGIDPRRKQPMTRHQPIQARKDQPQAVLIGRRKPLAPIATRLTDKQIAYFRLVYGAETAEEVASKHGVVAVDGDGPTSLAEALSPETKARLAERRKVKPLWTRGARWRLKEQRRLIGHTVVFREFA